MDPTTMRFNSIDKHTNAVKANEFLLMSQFRGAVDEIAREEIKNINKRKTKDRELDLQSADRGMQINVYGAMAMEQQSASQSS